MFLNVIQVLRMVWEKNWSAVWFSAVQANESVEHKLYSVIFFFNMHIPLNSEANIHTLAVEPWCRVVCFSLTWCMLSCFETYWNVFAMCSIKIPLCARCRSLHMCDETRCPCHKRIQWNMLKKHLDPQCSLCLSISLLSSVMRGYRWEVCTMDITERHGSSAVRCRQGSLNSPFRKIWSFRKSLFEVQGRCSSHLLSDQPCWCIRLPSRALSQSLLLVGGWPNVESFFLYRVIMATNEQLALEDLGKVHRLVETQGQLMTSEAVDQLAAVWERKINGLNLSADMAQKFVEQLKQGPWSDHHKKGLITAINSSVLKNTTSSPNRRKLQDIPNISTFLSKKDFEVLANANVPLQKDWPSCLQDGEVGHALP